MAEVPNLKDYIRRMAKADPNGDTYELTIDLLDTGFATTFEFGPKGLTAQEVRDLVEEVEDLADQMVDDGATLESALQQAANQVFEGKVVSQAALLEWITDQLYALKQANSN